MKHSLSTHLFVNHRLTTAWLERIQHAGIESVEIFCARQHFDYTNRAQVAEFGHWFRDSELKLQSLHAPIYTDEVWGRSGPHSIITITETVKAKRIRMVDEIKRALEVSETVPFQYLIQHLGTGGEEYDERKLDAAFSSLDELSVFARQRGVEILLENIPNALSSAERLMAFIGMTHLNLNFCFDTGHANMTGSIAAEFELMKDRIRSTHLHDNNGSDDTHLAPLVDEGGSIDWAETMELLRSRDGQYPLLLELKVAPGKKAPLDDALCSFERLESIR